MTRRKSWIMMEMDREYICKEEQGMNEEHSSFPPLFHVCATYSCLEKSSFSSTLDLGFVFYYAHVQ